MIMISFVGVKRMFAILFLSTYLFSTTELIQLLKLPVLIEHYLDHTAQKPEMSFVEYITLHYNSDHFADHPHDDDYEKDQKLPFMTNANVLSVCCNTVPNFMFKWRVKGPQVPRSNQKVYNEEFVESVFLSSIWQPPKSC